MQQKKSQHKAPSTIVPHSANQRRNLSKQSRSLTGKRKKEIGNSNFVVRNFKRVEWSKMLTLAGNTVVLELGSQSKKSFTSASGDDKNRFLNFYLRLRTAWLFDLVELNLSLQQYPSAPSVRASLKAITRVARLPLETFFEDIYGYGKYLLKKKTIPPKAAQVHMFNVARKLLLQRFYAGDASPSFIDIDGRTLLHVRA